MEVVKRYIHAVTQKLPEQQRADVSSVLDRYIKITPWEGMVGHTLQRTADLITRVPVSPEVPIVCYRNVPDPNKFVRWNELHFDLCRLQMYLIHLISLLDQIMIRREYLLTNSQRNRSGNFLVGCRGEMKSLVG